MNNQKSKSDDFLSESSNAEVIRLLSADVLHLQWSARTHVAMFVYKTAYLHDAQDFIHRSWYILIIYRYVANNLLPVYDKQSAIGYSLIFIQYTIGS